MASAGYAAGSLLTIADLPLDEVSSILAQADELETMDWREKAHLLAGRRVALLFYESSTRTRTSFELAAKSLGATTTLVSDKSSSIEKGESLKDTGLTLRALGAECIVLRHNAGGAPFVLARATGLPVLNAGDGMHQHPSQALLDLRTMLRRFGLASARIDGDTLRLRTSGRSERLLASARIDGDTLRGKTVVITGDIRHSRVARSNAMLLPRLGARVILCGPVGLLPEEEALALADGLEVERDFDRALATADVVMMLRIQRERLAGLELDLEGYVRSFQMNGERLAACQAGVVVMHPGPMIRGLEIAGDVADSSSSGIEEQVAHGLSIRSALLVRALGCA